MRRPDWHSRLAAVLKVYQRGEFRWGNRDCGLFVSDVINALTDYDPGANFRGRYTTMLGGYEAIKNYCQGGLEDIAEKIARERGFVEIDPRLAQRGDVGLYHDPELGATLGVSLGANFAFLGEQEMKYFAADQLSRAWRIG